MSSQAYKVAQNLLLGHLTDPHAAAEQFRWPELDRFNWALDWFDAELAAGPLCHNAALHILGETLLLTAEDLAERVARARIGTLIGSFVTSARVWHRTSESAGLPSPSCRRPFPTRSVVSNCGVPRQRDVMKSRCQTSIARRILRSWARSEIPVDLSAGWYDSAIQRPVIAGIEVAAHRYTLVRPSLAGLAPLIPWSLLHAAGLHVSTGSSSQHT